MKNIQNELTTSTIDEDLLPFFDENLSFDDNDSTIGSWLSLEHFPDDTRVQLTKRGRRFIFQSSNKNNSFIELIGRAKWNQYRSNTEVPVPLETIKTLLSNNKKELFLTSFSVTGIGSQKLLIPIKLPIKVPGSPITKIVALLCLTRNVFTTGNFQTDNQKKAETLIETFSQAFGFELPIGVNKRGNYIRIPLQFISALNNFFTSEEDFNYVNIIKSINRFSIEDIKSFLNTWFSFFRIYRNIKRPDQLFIFRRKNEVSEEIAKLLEKCEVEFYPGTIQENGNFISAYVIKNTEINHKILDLSFLDGEMDKKPDHLMLIKNITRLNDQINQKDEKIIVLEALIGKLNQELIKEQESKLTASYSRFYFESQTKKLEEKFLELKHIRKELEMENLNLRSKLKRSGSIFVDSNKIFNPEISEPDLRDISESTLDIVKNQIKESEIYNTSSFNAFIKYIKQKDSVGSSEQSPLLIQGDEEDDVDNFIDIIDNNLFDSDKYSTKSIRSNLTNPILTQKLIKALTLLMSRKENWILLSLAFEENKLLTEFEIRDLLDLKLSESRPLITNLIKSNQLEFGKLINGESGYSLKNGIIKDLRVNLENLLRKKTVPSDIKSEWKELFQLF